MKLLLDSSAIVFGFELPNSNSRIIFDLVRSSLLEGFISAKAIPEVRGAFAGTRGEKFLYSLEKTLRDHLKVIEVEEVKEEMEKRRGKIKEKDLEHLATAKALKLPYIVAYDRDFEDFKEYYTPKEFVEKVLKLRAFDCEH